MLPAAYWISPQGKILDVGASEEPLNTSIILSQYPQSFGLTRNHVEAAYLRNGETIGTEGSARTALIAQAVERGFIRVRLYKNSRWSITLNDLNDRMTGRLLQQWAALPQVQKDRYMPVYVLDIKAKKVNKDHTVHDLASGGHLCEGGVFSVGLMFVKCRSIRRNETSRGRLQQDYGVGRFPPLLGTR